MNAYYYNGYSLPIMNSGCQSSTVLYTIPPTKQFQEQLFICKRKRNDLCTSEQQPQTKKVRNEGGRQTEAVAPIRKIKVLMDGLNNFQQQNIKAAATDMIQETSYPGNLDGAIVLYNPPKQIVEQSVQKWQMQQQFNSSQYYTDMDIERADTKGNTLLCQVDSQNEINEDDQDEMEVD
eukprot:TRINITY_DN21917_c0_g2_i3.p4 TRINITY_DN21917_c0_g2~~TRINITY_DN21917_c0_g2_i3.p4  ORF type:complete len:178 (+),score=16.90 TRINITY_DN21917_c0_g2_i3:139-672(+)